MDFLKNLKLQLGQWILLFWKTQKYIYIVSNLLINIFINLT